MLSKKSESSKKPPAFKCIKFDEFEFYKFNYSYELSKARENAINTALSQAVPRLYRGNATSIGNNCLLDSVFQQIVFFLQQNFPQLINKLGTLYMFIKAIRIQIGKNQGEMLSINHPTQGLKIITAIQRYLTIKLGNTFAFSFQVLLADNDGELGIVDMSGINQYVNEGSSNIPVKLIYVNYNHYEPLFDAPPSPIPASILKIYPDINVSKLIQEIEDLIWLHGENEGTKNNVKRRIEKSI
jgi:hypothetical protein